MVEASNTSDRQRLGRWQFSLQGLFLFSFSVAIGLSFWKTLHDWYLGWLATLSFWVVFGLAAQTRDLWVSSRPSGDRTPDQRWGWRFALAWRLALCFLIGACFLLRLLFWLKILAVTNREDFLGVSSPEIWDAVLLTSLIAAIAGSRGLGRRKWRRPWSYAVAVFRGLAASALFLMVLEDRLIVPYLVHVTVVAVQLAQPLRYSMEVTIAASRTRVNQFHDIASAGAISVLVSCILLWRLSAWWRSPGRRTLLLGVLLAASLTAMLLLTARIAVVEIPAISPLMAAYICVPLPPQLAAAAVLTVLLAAAVARRWSEPPPAGVAPGIAAWLRDERRYYHERRVLLLPLGGVALAQCVPCAHASYLACRGYYGASDWRTVGIFFDNPTASLSLVLVLVTVQVAFSRRSKPSDSVATERPRLTPGLFLIVWTSLLLIIVCSATHPQCLAFRLFSQIRLSQIRIKEDCRRRLLTPIRRRVVARTGSMPATSVPLAAGALVSSIASSFSRGYNAVDVGPPGNEEELAGHTRSHGERDKERIP